VSAVADEAHQLPVVTGAANAARTLSGRRKAATLLIALGPDKAAEVFRYLPDDEVETLSLEMAKMREIPSGQTEALFTEVVENALAVDGFAQGGVEYAREVLERALGGERAAEVIGRLSMIIEARPFEFLRRTPPEQIHALLRGESPQTSALVIANLHTTLAASALAQYEEEEQAEIAMRVALLNETSPDVIGRVEGVMRQKLSNVMQQEYQAAGGVKSLADILNNADRSTERNVLEALEDRNAELAEEIRMLLFTFEDLLKLDDRSVQLVLKDVDQKDLALALRGVSDDVRDKILSNMSQRGAEMLQEEMAYQPPQRRRVVEEAQGRIVGVVRRLEEAGSIVISRGAGGEDEVL
jgi:flagellar motor switch protein FliG